MNKRDTIWASLKKNATLKKDANSTVWDFRMFDPYERSVRNVDEIVYHYTTKETAIEKILHTGTIRMGNFISMNDPKESKDWYFQAEVNGGYDVHNLEDFSLGNCMLKGADLIKSNCKIFCACRDNTDPRDIFLYPRGFALPRMWAQYGGMHRGACIAFDKKELTKCINEHAKTNKLKAYHADVSYRDGGMDPESITLYSNKFCENGTVNSTKFEQYIEGMVEEFSDHYFFHKFTDWSSEVETRWVLRGNSPAPELIDISKAIRGIVLGEDFDRAYVPLIAIATEKFGIKAYRIIWKNGSPIILPGV